MNNMIYDDATIDHCCLYLLGELSAAEVDDFDRHLATSAELRDCLSQQAELIAAIGTAWTDVPTTVGHAPAARARSNQWATAVVIALAASVLLAVGLWQMMELNPQQATETTQLARAWAIGRSEFEAAGNEWSVAGGDPVEQESSTLADEPQLASDEAGPPQWLVIGLLAMEAEAALAAPTQAETQQAGSDATSESAVTADE